VLVCFEKEGVLPFIVQGLQWGLVFC
jgi:hypothetical protein